MHSWWAEVTGRYQSNLHGENDPECNGADGAGGDAARLQASPAGRRASGAVERAWMVSRITAERMRDVRLEGGGIDAPSRRVWEQGQEHRGAAAWCSAGCSAAGLEWV